MASNMKAGGETTASRIDRVATLARGRREVERGDQDLANDQQLGGAIGGGDVANTRPTCSTGSSPTWAACRTCWTT